MKPSPDLRQDPAIGVRHVCRVLPSIGDAETATLGQTSSVDTSRPIEPLAAGLHVVVDGGIDDCLALAALVGAQVPIVQVIATEGSRSLEQTALTTARLLESLGSAVPVRLGAAVGVGGPYPAGRDPFHGQDCFGGQSQLLRRVTPPKER